MKPTIINLLFAFILLFLARFVVLEFFPSIIINGYFSIFLCFFAITILFTNSPFYSIIIGLLVVNIRIIYRTLQDKKTLNKYNSIYNCLIFAVALLLLGIFLVCFEKINKVANKYYGYIITGLILINFYSLRINEHDSKLLCFE